MDPHPGPADSAERSPAGPPPWPPDDRWQPPLTWPAPPPPPPATEPAVSRAGATHRRWPTAALAIGAVVIAAVGVGVGAADSTAGAASMAAQFAAAGEFANAIALDRVVAGRTGPLFVLDASAAPAAARAEQLTVLAWAAALGREGRIDEAVALYRSVPTGSLRRRATAALAALLYKSSLADAARGAYPSAVLRLDQLVALAPETSDGAQAERQLPIDQAGEASQLLAAGRGADAVALLDTVVEEGSADATTTADSLYPEALLVAGQEDVAEESDKEAVVDLQRLVAHFPGTPQATLAQEMLAAPVSVSGTLVDKNGVPKQGAVRLSTNYKALPGGTYKTSGPFSSSTADASGDFIFNAIPVGGPYVLEVFSGGNWTTLVDPSTGQPAHPVKVTSLIPVELTFVVLPS